MKKILVILETSQLPDPILDFIRNLYFEQIFSLKIIFLGTEELAYGPPGPQTSIVRVERFCKEHHFRCEILKDFEGDIKELLRETRYADLLLLSGWNTPAGHQYKDAVLHKAECPVLLLPTHYYTHDKNIFAYDGKSSCLHALKQFVQLFPNFLDRDTLVVNVDCAQEQIPQLPLLKEYMQQHFNSLAYYHLDLDPQKYFNTWVENRGKVMIISGARGRSALSEFLRKSFMKEMLREDQMLIFIAHR